MEQAILECRWTQNTTGRVAEQTVLGAAIKAKALGMDLSKCYISGLLSALLLLFFLPCTVCFPADADIVPRAVVHPSLKLRGRGPYGATPHPQTALFHLVITQRNDLPQQLPSIRLTGRPELEQLRARLRAWMVDRDAHYHYGVSKVTDSEGNVKLGRRKPEGIKELGGFPIVGVEKRRKVVVFN